MITWIPWLVACGPPSDQPRHIPVDREAGATSFRAAVDALKAGEIVGVFPEATISRSFELKEFKSGTVRMAAQPFIRPSAEAESNLFIARVRDIGDKLERDWSSGRLL